MLKSLRNYLITGLIILLPLIITVYIVTSIFNAVDGVLRPLVELVIGRSIYGLGFLLTIGFILGVGAIGTNVLGKRLIDYGERILTKIPLVRNIYLTVQQLIDALFLKNKTAFRKVVLIEYPRKGLYQVGFLTSEGMGEVQSNTDEEVINIFVPTTPNPTSGMLVLVPKEDITYLDMNVEEGLKLIISGGTVVPNKKRIEG
ncbi:MULTISPECIES: DUF502 domain-containing protein [unclassified Candidatus Frackibacter]|uniref:DUF502 domain-containing protein n=1 Tax=unclassified Candidatus Frackibacter TaxID=2648818 RepID=UPI00088C642D|nr:MULTISPECIES: DUF502 domain-containing protein [unclassified Candidatus Frackibacter]SDC74106.1 Uncharacterized membrane protein [Candidatus Frackibacter sp. WG11]SEM88149.1 Uncharacterized membrane protein [Candidatus Frackibacter sp. WG12]SFL97528.1 Uncharacterized membrane protein [Candidatus Frackibacter sp. WG13]